MCGLAGFLRRPTQWGNEQCAAVLDAMTTAVAHRGPDDQGVWFDAPRGIGLGHRRLSIVDPSPGGHQPMVSASGRLVIVFNGEIYNHAELRQELEAAGHRFRSACDTEVLLESVEHWGVSESCRRLLGMFAFAVWDRAAATLWLARDRLGKKPLYLLKNRDGWAFASEMKPFWRLPGFAPTLNLEALADYFRYSYVPDHLSIFNEVTKVSTGSVIEIRSNGTMLAHEYWSLPEIVARGVGARISDPCLAEESLLALLRDATQRRMLADVPLGAFLSGGIDSGLVVSLMQESSMQPIRTFSIGFDAVSHNEAPVAQAVARHLGTKHTELYVSAKQAQEFVPLLPAIFDEPFADASQIPASLLAVLTREHVTVALSGDGGDESFGGYARYRHRYGLLGACYGLPRRLRGALAHGIAGVPAGVWEGMASLLPNGQRPRFPASKAAKVARALKLDDAAERDKAFLSFWESPEILRESRPPRPHDPLSCPPGLLDDPSEAMQYWETRHYLCGDLLTKLDRSTMAASLEARCPLLDHRVVELAWRLSPDLKASDVALKRILRRLLFRYVPQGIVDLPKQGFSVPIGDWMSGALREWVMDCFEYGRDNTAGLLNWRSIDLSWSAHCAGRGGQAEKLWTVVMFCAWHRHWLSPATGRPNI